MVRMRHTPTLMRHRCGVGRQVDWLSFSEMSCEVGTKFKTCPIRNIFVCVRKGCRPPYVTFNTNISFLPLPVFLRGGSASRKCLDDEHQRQNCECSYAHRHCVGSNTKRLKIRQQRPQYFHFVSIFGLCGRLILVSFRCRQLLQKTSFSGIFWTSKFRPPLYLRKMKMLTKRPRTFTPQTCYRAKLRHSKINRLQSG